MIKRLLIVLATFLLAGATVVTTGSLSAGQAPGVPDALTSSCGATACW